MSRVLIHPNVGWRYRLFDLRAGRPLDDVNFIDKIEVVLG